MHKDGNLRNVFRDNLREIHWQPIESAITAAGIPDMNGCFDGVEFWIENKRAAGNAVRIDPFQVSWHERRSRAGGRTFLAVRLLSEAGPRKGAARDELFLYYGRDIRKVFDNGLSTDPIVHATGGPAKWKWPQIRGILLGR